MGDYQQARALDEDTLTRRRVLGADHPDTLTSAHNLADLHRLGYYQQARALDEDTLTRRRRVLGDDHPHTRQSEEDLAAVQHKLGGAAQSWPRGDVSSRRGIFLPSRWFELQATTGFRSDAGLSVGLDV